MIAGGMRDLKFLGSHFSKGITGNSVYSFRHIPFSLIRFSAPISSEFITSLFPVKVSEAGDQNEIAAIFFKTAKRKVFIVQKFLFTIDSVIFAVWNVCEFLSIDCPSHPLT